MAICWNALKWVIVYNMLAASLQMPMEKTCPRHKKCGRWQYCDIADGRCMACMVCRTDYRRDLAERSCQMPVACTTANGQSYKYCTSLYQRYEGTNMTSPTILHVLGSVVTADCTVNGTYHSTRLECTAEETPHGYVIKWSGPLTCVTTEKPSTTTTKPTSTVPVTTVINTSGHTEISKLPPQVFTTMVTAIVVSVVAAVGTVVFIIALLVVRRKRKHRHRHAQRGTNTHGEIELIGLKPNLSGVDGPKLPVPVSEQPESNVAQPFVQCVSSNLLIIGGHDSSGNDGSHGSDSLVSNTEESRSSQGTFSPHCWPTQASEPEVVESENTDPKDVVSVPGWREPSEGSDNALTSSLRPDKLDASSESVYSRTDPKVRHTRREAVESDETPYTHGSSLSQSSLNTDSYRHLNLSDMRLNLISTDEGQPTTDSFSLEPAAVVRPGLLDIDPLPHNVRARDSVRSAGVHREAAEHEVFFPSESESFEYPQSNSEKDDRQTSTSGISSATDSNGNRLCLRSTDSGMQPF